MAELQSLSLKIDASEAIAELDTIKRDYAADIEALEKRVQELDSGFERRAVAAVKKAQTFGLMR